MLFALFVNDREPKHWPEYQRRIARYDGGERYSAEWRAGEDLTNAEVVLGLFQGERLIGRRPIEGKHTFRKGERFCAAQRIKIPSDSEIAREREANPHNESEITRLKSIIKRLRNIVWQRVLITGDDHVQALIKEADEALIER